MLKLLVFLPKYVYGSAAVISWIFLAASGLLVYFQADLLLFAVNFILFPISVFSSAVVLWFLDLPKLSGEQSPELPDSYMNLARFVNPFSVIYRCLKPFF
jgi:hypothetical protein